MLAPFLSATDKSNPVNATFQLIVLVLFGTFAYFEFGPTFVGKPPIVAVSATAPVPDKELETQKTLYKIVKGVAEYCRNSTKIQKNIQVRDMIAEVGITYGMENSTLVNDTINSVVEKAGIKKDGNLDENKEVLVKTFDELALSIKTSIEKSQSK